MRMAVPRRYAVVGTGSRAGMYVDAMLGEHADVAVPVAWCDTNESRMAAYDERVRPHVPRHYHPDDLDTMLTEVDAVIVTSPDHTHAHVVTTALDAGVDVVCEKPLTIDAEGLAAIRRSVAASPARLTVTFNYRYSPRNSALRQVIADSLIGDVLSVHFEWLLDTVHGADYFRRWHRDKQYSGGLAVHKATHHFDLVNWWLDDVPESVVALGGMRFYGPDGAGRPAGPRPVLARDLATDDPFRLDMAGDDRMRRLYLDAEPADGYIRDHDVFAPGGNIEDTLSALVGYRGGASMAYSLTAHSPWEGYRVGVNGTLGRAELEVVERSHVAGQGAAQLLGPNGKRPAVDPSVTPGTVDGSFGARPHGARLVVQRQWGVAEEVPIPEGEGSHGGGDAILLRDVFRGPTEDPLRRQAGFVDGMHSVAVGIAVNQSLATGRPIRLSDTVLSDTV
jgi:predicted dehydrogenase